MNQPLAGMMNFRSFAQSLVPVLDEEGVAALQVIVHGYKETSDKALQAMWSRKMGLLAPNPNLFETLEGLMHTGKNVDYTIFWRELSKLPRSVEGLRLAFYEGCPPTNDEGWNAWLGQWHAALESEKGMGTSQMRSASPKYVPREWMLVDAYTAAARRDYDPLHALQKLFEYPYEEQDEFEAKYYRKADAKSFTKGGTAFMP